MKLYKKYLSIQVKSAFQYRASLIFDIISSALSTVTVFFGILMLFQEYTTVGGYGLNEILITYSLVYFAFSIAEMVFRGFDQFDKLVKTGELDRLLIRPRNIFIQVLGYKFEFNKLGRVAFSLIILIYALCTASIVWSFMKILTVILMIIGTIIIFAGLFLIFSSVSIFTIDGIEAVNVVTNGGRDLCQYPIDIYSGFFRKVFTYIIPLGVVNYIPLQYLLGYSSATIFNALAPLLSIVFFGLCYLIFKWSLTKYKSTGS